MKLIVSLTAVLVAASVARAQVVVVDPTAIAHNQANHAVDLAKYVEMVRNQVTQINTLTQQLQQIQAYELGRAASAEELRNALLPLLWCLGLRWDERRRSHRKAS